MLDKFKAIIEQVRILVEIVTSSATSAPKTSKLPKQSNLEISSENHRGDENSTMEAPNLLNSIEEVITHDFFTLKTSDTLSDALALVMIQRANEIIIVDNEGKFAGILRDISVLKEVPPRVLDVPASRRLKIPKIRKQVSEDLVNTLKKPISELFNLEKIKHRFSKTQRLIYALEELIKPDYYTEPRVIPILNNDETVAGIVSPKEILEYIKADRVFGETKVEMFLSEKFHQKELYQLLPGAPLEQAYFAMKYLPIDCIMICDDNSSLLGIVDRHQVSALTHPLYFHLMDMPLGEIMKPVGSLYLVDCCRPIEEIIDNFLELEVDTAIAVDRLANQIRPTRVITPISVLQLYLLILRQNRN